MYRSKSSHFFFFWYDFFEQLSKAAPVKPKPKKVKRIGSKKQKQENLRQNIK